MSKKYYEKVRLRLRRAEKYVILSSPRGFDSSPLQKFLRAQMLVAVCTNAHFADKLVIEYDKLNIQVSQRDRYT